MKYAEPRISKVMRQIERIPLSGCWVFTGTLSHDGYGQVGGRRSEGNKYAHRVSFEHFKQPIPAGLFLDHLCRVRCCVNPDHLEMVTTSENNYRAVRVKPTHCPQGHELKEPNLYTNGRKYKTCRACSVAAARRYQSKKAR